MKLVLKDGTIIKNVVASEKLLQIPFNQYSEISQIYAVISNDSINGSHLETETGITMGTYNDVVISTTTPMKNYVYFNLIDSRTAESEALKAKVEEQSTKLNEQDTTIAELSDLVDMLLVSTLEPVEETTGTSTESEVA